MKGKKMNVFQALGLNEKDIVTVLQAIESVQLQRQQINAVATVSAKYKNHFSQATVRHYQELVLAVEKVKSGQMQVPSLVNSTQNVNCELIQRYMILFARGSKMSDRLQKLRIMAQAGWLKVQVSDLVQKPDFSTNIRKKSEEISQLAAVNMTEDTLLKVMRLSVDVILSGQPVTASHYDKIFSKKDVLSWVKLQLNMAKWSNSTKTQDQSNLRYVRIYLYLFLQDWLDFDSLAQQQLI